MSDEADLRAEGEPEAEFDPGVIARIPRKRVAAGLLCRDQTGAALLVEPTYKPTWEIPGGVVEPDESPRAACLREVREELGVDLPVGRLLAVDWAPRHGAWPDGLLLVFDGGVLTPNQVAAITLPADELASFRFVDLTDSPPPVPLRASQTRRLRAALAALETGRVAELEFGRPV